ncbi:MAG: threonine synthase [Gammaproteobacteria bacterium]|nr:threonine synthase [Gammaproteobacteria bacterium]
MSFVTHLTGIGSGRRYAADMPMNLDPVDGRPVRMELDLEALARDYPDSGWYHPERSDMWRFGGLLPLDINDPLDRRHIVTLGEGHTPLLDASSLPLAKSTGLQLWIKDEGHPHAGFGENPTHSFKDRGMAVVASMAQRFGIDALAVPTQGNAGDSLCRYACQIGSRIVVAMPADTPMPILGAVAAAARLNENVTLELVEGSIREAGALLKDKYLPEGYFNCATFQEPGWRIEGKKTLGLEIAEALEDYSGWRLPDAIIYPTGGGTGVLGMWKAFDELQALGLVGAHRPRIYAVQSCATQPLVTAMQQDQPDTTPQSGGHTLAVGLNVPGGVGHFEVLRIIRASGGEALAISEEHMTRMFSDTWQRTGWWLCPEGAMALAAIPPLFESGALRPNETVVVVNTGSFEKYLPDVRHLLRC